MIPLPTKTDLTTTATLLATSLSHFHSHSAQQGGLTSAKYWEKVDKKARGPEMNVWVGWRVRFSFDKEEAKEKESRGKDVEVEVLRVEVE
ncbi:hypothetical protein SMACR_09258 [Sordaria macrospora]|uniref:WGS project CABT00000000 data, contig 2.80 n=2 Tax=Sordaria macrospora TaxID=5147 RepID=F7WBN0_SORMK|nr:uncharacterized protein SMAC_09258 [Sordaria macrospora k-hell]KAA8628175.1 hypothetical protein SMACR_09258 [Sordaria macrospora]KAH7625443.1 hypothetical protein B0T09DRAFT_361390 [Sordaria sp. MPI-SDFR-AT-0083]WPJ62582.1 hypothetical protein SMAC4_09258 [Sordaria macrospora]CCC05457.1 unnamed protein product [Sordaria macrospora k-hell]